MLKIIALTCNIFEITKANKATLIILREFKLYKLLKNGRKKLQLRPDKICNQL